MDENLVYFIMVALWVAYNIFKPNKKKKKRTPQQPQTQPQQQPQNRSQPKRTQPVNKPQQAPKTVRKKKPSSIESILEDYLKELEGQTKPKQAPKPQPKPKPVLTNRPEAISSENIEEITKHTRASVKAKQYAAADKAKRKKENAMKKKVKKFNFNALDAVIYNEIFNRKY